MTTSSFSTNSNGTKVSSDSRSLALSARTLEREGGASLKTEHLLGLILGRGPSALSQARRLLESDGWPTLVAESTGWPQGLPRAQAARLGAALELARRLARQEGSPRVPSLTAPKKVYELTADLRLRRREHFVGLYLNARNRLLARETVSVGSLNASIVHPREVFEPALRHAAASLVVVHNHPSGETDPSRDDLSITRRLAEAGEILGVPLLDHVIVGASGFTSLKEQGRL